MTQLSAELCLMGHMRHMTSSYHPETNHQSIQGDWAFSVDALSPETLQTPDYFQTPQNHHFISFRVFLSVVVPSNFELFSSALQNKVKGWTKAAEFGIQLPLDGVSHWPNGKLRGTDELFFFFFFPLQWFMICICLTLLFPGYQHQ